MNSTLTDKMWKNKSSGRALRVPITIDAARHERVDKPVELETNFTQLLGRNGDNVTFDEKSMRFMEVDTAGKAG